MNHTLHTRAVRFLPELFCFFSIFIIVFFLNSGSPAQTGWYQQPLPVSGTIYDMQFIDANTGWISLFNPFSFIKTTNGGSNWTVISSGQRGFGAFDFLNDTIGYIVGADDNFNGTIRKTSNGGLNWTLIYTGVINYIDPSFISNDTGYLCGYDGAGGIWKTTDGGASLSRIYITGFAPQKIFFIKKPYDGEYYGWWLGNGYMSKTTNSGVNWSEPTRTINGETGDFLSLFFLNKDTGWVNFRRGTDYRIYKTQNGGDNWVQQYRDSIGIYGPTYIEATSFENVWAGNDFWNIIHASSNGGNTWGRQSTSIFRPIIIEMADSLNGWTGLYQLAHTTDGGGMITYTGIDPSNTEQPVSFILGQNYPNPFNPQTTIKFSVSDVSTVSLILYDITGKEVIKIYENEVLVPGNYKVILDFSKLSLSGGTYLYSMKAGVKGKESVFGETKKMIYLK